MAIPTLPKDQLPKSPAQRIEGADPLTLAQRQSEEAEARSRLAPSLSSPGKQFTTEELMNMANEVISAMRTEFMPHGSLLPNIDIKQGRELVTAMNTMINTLVKHKHATREQKASMVFEQDIREVLSELSSDPEHQRTVNEIVFRLEEKLKNRGPDLDTAW